MRAITSTAVRMEVSTRGSAPGRTAPSAIFAVISAPAPDSLSAVASMMRMNAGFSTSCGGKVSLTLEMIPSLTSRIVGCCPRRRSACVMVRATVSVSDGSRTRATEMRPRHVASMSPLSTASSRSTCIGGSSTACQYERSQFHGCVPPAMLAMRSHARESSRWSRPRRSSMGAMIPYRIASHHPTVRVWICTRTRRGARTGLVMRISAP